MDSERNNMLVEVVEIDGSLPGGARSSVLVWRTFIRETFSEVRTLVVQNFLIVQARCQGL